MHIIMPRIIRICLFQKMPISYIYMPSTWMRMTDADDGWTIMHMHMVDDDDDV